jgi:hypothetical protein
VGSVEIYRQVVWNADIVGKASRSVIQLMELHPGGKDGNRRDRYPKGLQIYKLTRRDQEEFERNNNVVRLKRLRLSQSCL